MSLNSVREQTCFHSGSSGCGTEFYRSRIGATMGKRTWKQIMDSGKAESLNWFLGIVLRVLLLVGGVEVNPGPAVEQDMME